jgi:hypothetical protein
MALQNLCKVQNYKHIEKRRDRICELRKIQISLWKDKLSLPTKSHEAKDMIKYQRTPGLQQNGRN